MARQEVQVRFRTLDGYLTPAAREAILRRIAALAIGRIKRRTGQGKDVEGKAFAPYSARYAKQRRETGRKDQPVTLLLSGQMLASMDILQADARRAVIGFKGSAAALKFARRTRTVTVNQGVMGKAKTKVFAADKKTGATHVFQEQNRTVANGLKAAWNDRGEGHNPRRHFFGLSREDKAFLVKDALRQVIEAVRTVSMGRLTNAGALRRARLAGR